MAGLWHSPAMTPQTRVPLEGKGSVSPRERLRRGAGFTLIEVLVALGILGLTGTTFMAALAGSTRSTGSLGEQVQAAALARTQLEDIQNLPYSNSYPVTASLLQQYAIFVQAQPLDDPNCLDEYLPATSCNTLQRITVSVSHGDKPILSLTSYRKK